MLVVMIPTYNEAENIAELIKEILALRLQIKIIVVDDNSPDGTARIAESMGKKTGKVAVIKRGERGRGTAGIRGLQEALKCNATHVIEMDADFSHDPSYIPALLETAKKYDIAIGSRMIEGGDTEGRGIFRDALSSGGALFTRAVLGLNVLDAQSGYKCYRRRVLESMDFTRFVSHGYSIGAELLYRAKRQGFTMSEIPIVFENRKRGKSKVTLSEIITSMLNVVRIRMGR
ncbi:MAG: polyprenol monophosphomannose synthase [Candidatus Aenigmarchaeota archaeon]|nr:polyprenol monophosphomannose synthase [Candidatus Aenigmarchaeota archaeon]